MGCVLGLCILMKVPETWDTESPRAGATGSCDSLKVGPGTVGPLQEQYPLPSTELSL